MKKILWVCSDLPFPSTHGGRVDMWERIKKVSSAEFCIDLVCTIKSSEAINKEILEYVDRVILVERTNSIGDYLGINPFQVESRKNLSSINLRNTEYDFLMLESEHVYFILENQSFSYKKVAVRIHNDEVKYFSRLASAENKLIYKFYYILDSLRLNRIIRKLSSKVDNYFFISDNDFNDCNLYNENKFNRFYQPTPFNRKEEYKIINEFNVLFVGSFFMVNNQEAIFWYLNHIHQKLNKTKGYKLILVGNDKGVSDVFFNEINAFENVEVYRSPDDLNDFYKKSMIFINPMQNGAGVKLKTINAVEYSLPIVSTSIGSEGTRLEASEDFLLADDPDTFYQSIMELYKSEKLRNKLCTNAYNRLNSEDIVIKQIKSILED